VGVLAHEIGHYKKKHIIKGMIVSMVHSAVMLYLLGLFVNLPELSLALGVEQPSFHIGIIAFGLLYSPISTLLGIAGNVMSRKHEYEADAFAAMLFRPEPLQNALKKLSVNNLSNLRPHPLHVFVNYSHPPLLQRLGALERLKNEHEEWNTEKGKFRTDNQ
jgi:STE24 endopeptidase